MSLSKTFICYNTDYPGVALSRDDQKKFFFVFDSVLCPIQDYFSSYETGQSVGGAKMGEPREKPPGIPTCRTWLVSHVVRAGLKPTPDIGVR